MENRRQHFRQLLFPTYRIAVTFRSTDGTGAFDGEIVNLSIGGMRIKAAKILHMDDKRWHAFFTLDDDATPLKIPVEHVYAQDDVPGYFGFRFLPRTNIRDQEAQERTIWSFLLDLQRNDRRRAREAQRMTG